MRAELLPPLPSGGAPCGDVDTSQATLDFDASFDRGLTIDTNSETREELSMKVSRKFGSVCCRGSPPCGASVRRRRRNSHRSPTSSSSWATTSAGCSRASTIAGLMVGETPNIDRIGQEGAIFMDYVAMQSCTSGRNAFFTGMYPLRTGMIPPQLPGSPSYLRPGTPALAKFLHRSRLQHRRVRQEPPGRPHRGPADGAWLPGVLGLSLSSRRHAAGELPRHQQVAAGAGYRAAVQEHADPRLPEVPGAVDPQTTICLTPPRPVISCKSSDGTEKNQTCKDEGPLTLDRSKTVDEEISAKVIDFLDRNDPKKTNKPFFVWYNPARMHVTTVLSPKYWPWWASTAARTGASTKPA